MIDHTSLVHDTLSFMSTFAVISTSGQELDHEEEHNVLSYRWSLIDSNAASIPAEAELIAHHSGKRWAGTPIR